MPEVCLDMLVAVLGKPADHLWGKKETMILDGMCIKRDRAGSDASEVTYHELYNSEGLRIVVLPVAFNGAEIRKICR
jgi:hypothetical protein